MTEGKLLYIDPWMGVAGDMLMAALLDIDRAGSHLRSVLAETLGALDLDPKIVSITREVDQGIECTQVRVSPEDNTPLRHLSDLVGIVEASTLSQSVRDRSRSAFERLAAAEASVHGCSVDEIHFHEVGALDTLVDVVGVFALVEALGVDEIWVGEIPLGGGTVTIAHGAMRVPAPATSALLEGYPVVGGPEMRELTTPTGALLVGELQAKPGSMPAMTIEGIGYGCGTMRFPHRPNVLRVSVGAATGRASAAGGEDLVSELETNIDDASPEIVGNACRLLREVGALDVWTTPAFMKKDRPGVVLHALVKPEVLAAAAALVMRETGSLGIRHSLKRRIIAERGLLAVDVGGAQVDVKWGRDGDEIIGLAPEFDHAVAAAAATGLSVREVMFRATEKARQMLGVGRQSVDGGES